MRSRFTKAEREEVVTKGFLVDYLDDYVTKDYLDEVLREQTNHIEQRIEVLMENQMHQLQILFETMDERYVLRREWLASQGSSA